MENTLTEQGIISESKESTNPFANIWLTFLGVMLIGTLLCTLVLVAWPVVATLVAAA